MAFWNRKVTAAVAAEKLFLSIGSIGTIILILYFLLIDPFYASLSQLKDQVNYNQQLAQSLMQANKIIKTYKNQGISTALGINTQSLLVTINDSAREEKLYQLINRITQSDNNSVTVQFSKVPFDQMIEWITTLWQQYGVSVDQIDVIPLKNTGLVKANVILTTDIGT